MLTWVLYSGLALANAPVSASLASSAQTWFSCLSLLNALSLTRLEGEAGLEPCVLSADGRSTAARDTAVPSGG